MSKRGDFLLKKSFLFAILFLSFTVTGYCAQIYGKVIESVTSSNSSSNAPTISGAIVIIEDTNFKSMTNNGYFAFPEDIPNGVYNIGVYKDGYHLETKKVNVSENIPISLTFILTKKQQAPILSIGTMPSIVNIPDAVCIAYSSISASTSSPGSNMTSLQFLGAIAAGVEPTTLGGWKNPGIDSFVRGDDYTPVGNNPNSIALMDPHSPKNTTYVNFNTKPFWLTFDNSGTKLFISTNTKYIVVLDAANGNRIGLIPAGGMVTDITRAPDGNVYAAVSGSRRGVLVISPSTNSEIAFYKTKPSSKALSDAQPSAIAVDSKNIYLAMSSTAFGEVQALNKSGGALLGTCETGQSPSGICLTPNGKYLFIANRGGGDLSVIDAKRLSVMGRVRVGSQPTRIVSSPLGDRIYVTNFASNYVSVIDGRTGTQIATINTGKGPVGIGITPDGTRVFVSNNSDNNITIINAETNTVIQTTTPSTTSKPFGIAVKPGL